MPAEGARELAAKIVEEFTKLCDCAGCAIEYHSDAEEIAGRIEAYAASAVARERERILEFRKRGLCGAPVGDVDRCTRDVAHDAPCIAVNDRVALDERSGNLAGRDM